MPRSPTRTSTGSPGTSRIATNVTNISATKVGIVSAIRRRRYLSKCCAARLLEVDPVELGRAQRALLVSRQVGTHHLVDDRVRDLHVGRGVVLDRLHLDVELRALLLVRQRLGPVEAIVEALVAPLREVLPARARGGASAQEEEVVRVAVVTGPAELHRHVL